MPQKLISGPHGYALNEFSSIRITDQWKFNDLWNILETLSREICVGLRVIFKTEKIFDRSRR